MRLNQSWFALTLLVTAFGFGEVALAFPKVPLLDIHGYALPQGAYARLGTSKLRAGSHSIHFSADGKKLVGVDGLLVHEWDAGDGRLLDSHWLDKRGHANTRRSEDGRTLIVFAKGTIELWDLTSKKKLDLPVPTKCKSVDHAVISADRRWILLADSEPGKEPRVRRLLLFDTRSDKIRTLSEHEAGIVWIGFSPDGSKAVTTGGSITKLWDIESGKCLWEVPNYGAEETHFTPDGKHLVAAPGGGQNQWHIWDAATGKPAKDLKAPTLGYVWMFDVSQDGTQLILPTETDYVLWDMKAGTVKHRWPGAIQSGRGIFAPDGKSVITHNTTFQRWDLTTGTNLYANVATLGHTVPVRKMFFTPDGSRMISIAADFTARAWDVKSSRLLRTLPIPATPIDAWCLSPDGEFLIGIDEKLAVHRWSVLADSPRRTIELRDAQKLEIGLRAKDACIGVDGSLTMLGWPRLADYRYYRFSFSKWDFGTGKLIRWGEDPGQDYRGEEARLSPDGSWAAMRDGLFDIRSGLRRAMPASPIGAGGAPVFSPDGRLIASSGGGVRVWELATGRAACDLPRGAGAGELAAFSPAGRRLACVSADRLVVWDLQSAKPVAEWLVPEFTNPNTTWLTGGFAFSPDGKTLATGHNDGTILLRLVPATTSENAWTANDEPSLWNDLADETPSTAYAAIWQLASQPANAVELLKQKYPLVPSALPEDWTKLIARLDSSRFAEREAASKRISELGRAGYGHLKNSLKAKLTPEQTRRIEALLAELEPTATRPRGDDLRAVRAVAVLETCGTREARQLLVEWAERGSTPRLADEAARASDRLKPRP